MTRGFTLVELSIVLVIIGLLVGGILAAQSMINTARIQNYIRSLQQHDIAVNNFKNNYKFLPGDSLLFTPPGNGDGSIGGTSSMGCDSQYVKTEMYNVWAHLTQSQMLKENYSAWQPIGCGGSDPDEPLKLAGVISPIFSTNNKFSETYDTNKTPLEYLNTPLGSSFPLGYHVYVDGLAVVSLDAKMDDGNTGMGNLYSENESADYCGVSDALCNAYILQNIFIPQH